jgi:predicted aspartyl protease
MGCNQSSRRGVERGMRSRCAHGRRAPAAVAVLLLPWLFASPAAVGAEPEAAKSSAPPASAASGSAATTPEGRPELVTRTTLDRIGRIAAPVEINGRKFRFVLDTGANRSAISAATAEALGLVPADGALVNVHGVTGSATLPVVQVASFRVGELLFENQKMPVLPSAVFAGMDGILGVDCLQDARVEVDFGKDRVTIQRSSGRRARRGYLVVPAWLQHGGLLLVDGQVGRVPVKAILDTGAERSLGNEALRAALALSSRRIQESVSTTVIGATPQLGRGESLEAPSIDIGGARLNNLTVTFGDLHVFNIWSLIDEPALLIGMDLLGTLEKFVVDYSRHEFHLKPVSTRPAIRHCGGSPQCASRIPPPDA